VVSRAAVWWWPEALEGLTDKGSKTLRRFAYVVLEELVDEQVVLMAWPWPHADQAGHLYWSPTAEQNPPTAAIDRGLLQHQLYRPNRLQRVPRLGDVYAASGLGRGWDAGEPVLDARQLFEGPLYDITADAREASKLAYLGAVATIRAPQATDGVDQQLLAQASKRRARLTARELRLSPPPAQTTRSRR